MGFFPRDGEYLPVRVGDGEVDAIANDAWQAFDEHFLGLGDLSVRREPMDAVCAMFDLAGFTTFCSRTDSYLFVGQFVREFNHWLFEQIRNVLTMAERGGRRLLFAPLPFFAKSTGDGMLLLWNTASLSDARVCNVPLAAWQICQHYGEQFYPEARRRFSGIPHRLRCGLARGHVLRVGDDFAGAAINMSARLQKLYSLSFAFATQGFDPRWYGPPWNECFVIKEVVVRGVHDRQLVWIARSEFAALDENERLMFFDP